MSKRSATKERKPAHKCVFLQIAPALSMCECGDTRGPLSYQKGAVDEARRLVERAGGFEAIRARLNHERAEKARRTRREREAREKAYGSAGYYGPRLHDR